MRFDSLRLKNIRSYTDETITFPTGILLLTGDIGAGKSTILLAIEFALFGLLRGTTSGTGLLRNGAREGSVQLAFEANGKHVTITRALKRLKETIAQDAGTITVDGKTEDLTANELKARVLDILGYPDDLIAKNTSLLYRYTVYTAQEDMKAILAESTDDRLQTLRRLFNIDKYRRITDNAKIISSELRGRRALLDGKTADLPRKHDELTHCHTQLAACDPTNASHAFERAKQHVDTLRTKLTTLDTHLATTRATQKTLAETRVKILLHDQEHQRNTIENATLHRDLTHLHATLNTPIDRDAIKRALAEHTRQSSTIQTALRDLNIQQGAIRAKLAHATDTLTKIHAIDTCPLCLQHVTHEHKHAIKTDQDAKRATLETEAARLATLQKQHDEDATTLRDTIDDLQHQDKRALADQLQRARLADLQTRHAQLMTRADQLASILLTHKHEETTLVAKLVGTAELEQHHDTLQNELDTARQTERAAELEHARILHQRANWETLAKTLTAEIEQRTKDKDLLGAVHNVAAWLTDHFIPLIGTMETNVFGRVHHQFNELFQTWFGILVEDALTARLDERFTPIITQNGYDIDVAYLSGGERTACALAYRLALNRVINDLNTTIHTKDVLILDEPSDGFSSEQMDKLRDVLDQLRLSQVIIVSHESKIESFVQHVIRVEKEEHESRVAA